MKVLWFSATPSLYSSERNIHNGGGWIESLEKIMYDIQEVELGVSFVTKGTVSGWEKVDGKHSTYYPITLKHSKLRNLIIEQYSSAKSDKETLGYCLQIIEDFMPDVIQVFGSEWCFGKLSQLTTVPVVIHMQGSWPAYRNAQFPPGFSYFENLIKHFYNPKKLLGNIFRNHLSIERAEREENILSSTKFFMGRTRWDKALVKLYAPSAHYYYCPEALRDGIMKLRGRWNKTNNECFVIVSTGAGHSLKGYDVILKTAKIIKERSEINFKWILIGPSKKEMAIFEKKTDIYCEEVHVVPLGRRSADEVADNLLKSDLYVHASYIDNSPNSICEAQYLGIPIITTNVGGIPSLFDSNYPNDLFVPTNDPYYLASKIISTIQDKNLCERLSMLNKTLAIDRHNPSEIKKTILEIYKQICRVSKT